MNRFQTTTCPSTLDGASRRTRQAGLRLGRLRDGLFAALISCVVFLALTAPALAAGGSISGKVIGAKSKMPLAGVIVTAVIGSEFPTFEAGHATTDAAGNYTIIGLYPGAYEVKFTDSQSGYAAQYYHAGGNVPTLAEAEPVQVREGETTSGVGAALREGGTISGTVTGPFGEPMSHAEVRCHAELAPGCPSWYTETDASGRYRFPGLNAGSYVIEFSPPAGQNLVVQAYKDAASIAQATPVQVDEEQEYSGIGAVLEEGASITGRVTDAVTHQPVAYISVEPTSRDLGGLEGFGGGDLTNANGEYRVDDLRSGSFELLFMQIPKYLSLYTVDYMAPTVAGVGAVQGTTTTGINVVLVRSEPVNTAAPLASGTPAVGKTLSCSSGSWTGVQSMAFSYSWLRNGSMIDGASRSTYVVQTADRRHGLACQVTATNDFGVATATSSVLQVTPPPTIETVGQSHLRWSESNEEVPYSPKHKPAVGTTFWFVLDQHAAITLAFTHQLGGRNVKGECVADIKTNRRKPGCKRSVTIGTLSATGHAGLNKVLFGGRIPHGKRLPLGGYTVWITAMTAAGQRSKPRSLNFTIVG